LFTSFFQIVVCSHRSWHHGGGGAGCSASGGPLRVSDNSWQISLFEFACKVINLMSAIADAPASAFMESTHGMAEAMSKARMQLLCVNMTLTIIMPLTH
jgi:hypothetical protein